MRGLLSFCIDFVEKGEGTLHPCPVVFLLLIYFSKVPEKYLPMFGVKPPCYNIDPYTNTRRYEFDEFIEYLNKWFMKKRQHE